MCLSVYFSKENMNAHQLLYHVMLSKVRGTKIALL